MNKEFLTYINELNQRILILEDMLTLGAIGTGAIVGGTALYLYYSKFAIPQLKKYKDEYQKKLLINPTNPEIKNRLSAINQAIKNKSKSNA